MTLEPRLDPAAAAPEGLQAMLHLEATLRESGLEGSLVELVKIRASQINGCAFCLHMHTRDARRAGESEERLFLLDAWRESPLYNDRERAALGWAEALTLLPQSHAPDPAYRDLEAHFSERDMANLTLLIGAINVWNRLAVGFRLRHPAD